MYSSPVAQKYHEGKMQSTLERELNVPETAAREEYDAYILAERYSFFRQDKRWGVRLLKA